MTPLNPLISNDQNMDKALLNILSFCGDASSSAIKAVSKRLYAGNKLCLFDKITDFIPRSLTDIEKKLPLTEKLAIIEELVNQTDDLGRTPFIKATIAARVNSSALKAMRILVCLGAQIDQPSTQGFNAEYYAEYWNNTTALRLIQKMRCI